MNDLVRPQRDFTIKHHETSKKPKLDVAVQGHIERLLAQKILEGEGISFAFDGDAAELTAESHMLISGKASELLTNAHNDDLTLPDLSKEVAVKNMLIKNALEIVAAHERASIKASGKNFVLPEVDNI